MLNNSFKITILIVLFICVTLSSVNLFFHTKSQDKIRKIEKDVSSLLNMIEEARKLAEGQGQPQGEMPPGLLAGESAPEFSLPDLHGNLISLTRYRDEKNIVLYAWMPGCAFCEELNPKLNDFYKKYKAKKDFDVLAVTRIGYDEEKKSIREYVDRNNLNFKILLSGQADRDRFGQDYKITQVPTIWVIGKDLRIKSVLTVRELAEEKLEDLLLRVL